MTGSVLGHLAIKVINLGIIGLLNVIPFRINIDHREKRRHNCRMAESDGITEFQSFSDRALKYGRNVMATSVVIIVLAWVPAVDLVGSKPLNFEITTGGEIWIWRMLLAILMYYGIRFFGLAYVDLMTWRTQHGGRWDGYKNKVVATERALSIQLRNADNPPDVVPPNEPAAQRERRENALQQKVSSARRELFNAREKLTNYWRHRIYFWLTDVLPPSLFSALALAAGIIRLVCPEAAPPIYDWIA